MNDKDADLLVQWAGWAGQHALALFFAALALLLVTSWTFWWALLRYAGHPSDTRLSPSLVLALRVATGFAVILGSAALFAELADGLDAEEELGRADQAFTAAVAVHVPPVALEVFAALTRLGDPATLVALC